MVGRALEHYRKKGGSMSARVVARLCVAILVLILIAVCGHAVPFARGQATPGAGASEVIRLPAGWQLNRMPLGPFRTEVALSPDGSSLVFSATPDGTMEKAVLYRRALDRGDATVIQGTNAACMPIISPDGQWIAFWAKGRLYRVAMKGGAVQVVCDLPARPFGISWGPDGTIAFGTADAEGGGLWRVPAEGGSPVKLTTIEAGKEVTHRLPQVLPGGRALLFTVMPAQFGTDARIESLSLETGKRKVLIEDGADARYVPTGHLVFMRRGTLMAAPFSPDRLEITGPAVTIQAGVMQALNSVMSELRSGAGQFSVSNSGSIVFVPGGMFPEPLSDLYWVDRSGRAEKWAAFGSRPVEGTRLSPDGQRLAYGTGGLNTGIYLYDIRRNTSTKLTSGGRPMRPVWTPDGNRLVFSWFFTFSTTGPSPSEIWWAAGDGSAAKGQLAKVGSPTWASAMSPDGKYLALVDSGSDTGSDVRVLRMVDRQVVPFAVTKANETFPEFSPDGRWVAYVSNESGRNEVYARSFPDGKRTLQISSEGGMAPGWAHDGRELFYWDIGFTKMMKVDITPGENFSARPPRVLFEFDAATQGSVRGWDLTSDGQRFLVRKKKDFSLPPVTELSLVRNRLR